ncbi:uncharacterized protein LOC124898576 [Capsicum annuum]|uniref:uncharacterized protein LOC124898576 n=1 Tax=Capsicum annuum TaxID=4072 RepID=UPI001FB13267|nr:uncharacterized protein LOC124898576 [Capsicum annuum]
MHVTMRLLTINANDKTSTQVEVSNREIKSILAKTVNANWTDWAIRLDDALWAYFTAYKTPIGASPYQIVYEKSFHLPIELEHKALWALKALNLELKDVAKSRFNGINELHKFRLQTYESRTLYKEDKKLYHDRKIEKKLKSRWHSPFTVTRVYSYGVLEIMKDGTNPFKVNGHRVKNYMGNAKK